MPNEPNKRRSNRSTERSPSPLIDRPSPTASPDWRVLSDFGGSYSVQMSVDAWIALAEHPRRRDTERQTRNRYWESMRSASGPRLESLRWVYAAELNGSHFKVDGHTRALLWGREELPRPSFVIAGVFRCSTREQLNELYANYDTGTIFDRVTGAYREWGLNLTSDRLSAGTIASALSIAYRGFARTTERNASSEEEFDVYEAVGYFARELAALDTVKPETRLFPTGVVAAALLSLAVDPETLDYFRRLANRQGSKREGLSDPVEAVLDELQLLKKRGSARVRSEQEDLCARTLAAVRAWRAGPESSGYWGRPRLDTELLTEAVRAVRSLRKASAPST